MDTHESQSTVDVPLISVIVPVYNGSRTVEKTLESLASQDYPRMEWIIIDDASNDNSAQVVETFRQKHGVDFRFIQHEVNNGIAQTWNHGIGEAAGQYALIVHQDVELQGSDWISRALSRIEEDDRIAVVTCNYGIPASDELTFVMRAFGFLRQQFHRPPKSHEEFVTFSEFKCDLVRKSVLLSLGGFPESYSVGGQDITVSFAIRRSGGRIVKVYGLKAVQRFSGQAETFFGNLSKEFSFGVGNARVISNFRTFALRDLDSSRYGTSRFVHRAFQPLAALAILLTLVLCLSSASSFSLALLAVAVIGRIASHSVRLWGDFRIALPTRAKALFETLIAGVIGLTSDFVYGAGTAIGFLRHLMESVSDKGRRSVAVAREPGTP